MQAFQVRCDIHAVCASLSSNMHCCAVACATGEPLGSDAAMYLHVAIELGLSQLSELHLLRLLD